MHDFESFVEAEVAPFAERWDREQALPEASIRELAGRGWLGGLVPRELGGPGFDVTTFGLLNEALGRGSSALANVVTVQSMVTMTLLKWGSEAQKRRWVPRLARGEILGAFALTEPEAGSATQSLATRFTERGAGLVLNGRKRWISCAQLADVFLVFGMLGERPLACLVPGDSSGLAIEPITELMGFRAAGLAELRFADVPVGPEQVVGRPGFALSHVAPVGLHYGRIGTACSALGLARGCLEASASHAATRSLGAGRVGDRGMIRTLLARMAADVEAARLLCRSACAAEEERLPQAFERVLMAKYFASRCAVRAASDAVQIHGAAGCHASSAVSRYYRDAKILEIIEGTTQVHEDLLGRMLVDRAGRNSVPSPAPIENTDAPFPDRVTIQELIESRVAAHPERTAVICEHDTTAGAARLTYAQVDGRANVLAHRLRAAGVGPGHVTALVAERSFAMIVGILGVLKAGAAYLPLSPGDPPERLGDLLRDAGVRVLLAQSATRAAAIPFDGTIVDITDPELGRDGGPSPPRTGAPDDLAYVIYTSGSTGRPKGVMIEQRSLVNRLHWMQSAYPIGEGDVILQKTPFNFDVSVWELLWWALEGATLCMLAPGGERNPRAILDATARHGVTVMHFVPSMLGVFLEHLEAQPASVADGLSSVRRVFASGEALTPSHVRRFNQVWGGRTGARLTNLYGPTEATIDVSRFDCPTHGDFDVIPIGRAIQNTRLYVLCGDRAAAVGETGELCIAGVGLARGYLNHPGLTAEKFTDNPVRPGERIYRTGDLARFLPDGNLEYLGREDQQVKLRGMRIELGEIENTIREYAGVVDCAAVVKKCSDSVSLIVAYVVTRSELAIGGLRGHLKRRLPDYMIPHRFERIPEMPVTSSGKADRKALLETAAGSGPR